MAPSVGRNGLSSPQIASLKALVDAILPPLTVPPTQPKTQAARRYWEYRLAADPNFLDALEKAITERLSASDRLAFSSLLSVLSTSFGTSLVFGTLTQYPFAEWPVPQQTQLLKTMQMSSILQRRRMFNGVKRLICGLAYSYTDGLDNNPAWEGMGYPGPPQQSFVSQDDDDRKVAQATSSQGEIANSILNIEKDTEIECDVVIVGSGAGGCVAASVLAKAGYAVLVLEKGAYVPPDQISNLEADAFENLYESHGLLTTSDGAIMILAGSTVGGGTTVNWSCCLPLPDYVRAEWVREYELEAFRSGGDYDQSLNFVLQRIGANDNSKVKHNPMNRKLQEGCDALGYQWEPTRQNLKQTDDPSAGYISFGDRYGNKNNGVATFLHDAVKDGACLVDQCIVERITKSYSKGAANPRRMRATGVLCRVGDHEVVVIARKCVVVSAGSLHTPCLLQRSGFHNRHIGEHLHLHPTTATFGLMEPSEHIDGFLGAPLTTVCNTFEQGPMQDGYGAKIECPSAHPGLLAAGLQWTTPEQFKDRLFKIRDAVFLLAIQRDRGEGRVKLGRDGYSPKIDYVMSDNDKESLMGAVQGNLLILLAAGAQEVSSSHMRDTGFPIHGHSPGQHETLQAEGESITNYLSQVATLGMKRHEVSLFSAHQMGSCRMSSSPLSGAVDINAETWECDDLHVLDASIFPSAAASNPMVTVLAIAHMLSKRLSLRLRHRDNALTNAVERKTASDLSSQRTSLRSYPLTVTTDWRAIIEGIVRLFSMTAVECHSMIKRVVCSYPRTKAEWHSMLETLVPVMLALLIFAPIYSALWLDLPWW